MVAAWLDGEVVNNVILVLIGEQGAGEFMPVALALQIISANIAQKLSSVLLGRAFVELGFKRRTMRNVRGYIVVRRSAEEMRSLRMALAAASDNTDTDHTDVF
jgi:ABC-type microcin C transport system duplicated ATPase subunit YejF